MSDCRQIAPLITSYVEQGLADDARQRVERHVAACPPCRVRLTQEKGARAALRQCAETLTREALPPGLASRCRALARADEETRTGAGWTWRSLIPAAVAIGIVAALIGGVAFVTAQS